MTRPVRPRSVLLLLLLLLEKDGYDTNRRDDLKEDSITPQDDGSARQADTELLKRLVQLHIQKVGSGSRRSQCSNGVRRLWRC